MNAYTSKKPEDIPWVASPSGASGCFSRKLFEYGSEALGRDGAATSYTTLYRFDRGARYPAWRVLKGGAVEIYVLQGTLHVNGSGVPLGTWIQLREHEDGWSIGSVDCCEILAIVRGRIELVRPA